MSFTSNKWRLPYPSQRMPVFAKNMVATSQPLAAQAGLRMLQTGGNAVDAALASAIALTVVEPCSNGIGGDAFAIVWHHQQLHGLNGSGRSPRAWSPKHFSGRDLIPQLGWDSVTIPGAVDGWVKLSSRFGKLPFETLFEPAIQYASDGFLVSPIIADAWAGAPNWYADYPEFADAFLPNGRAPTVGELFRQPDQAQSLSAIAQTRGESFYRGELADRLVAHARQTGGTITTQDMAEHQSDWVDPISIDYGGLQLHEIPPNGQGLAALIALGILRYHDVQQYSVDSADSVHLQIEAMKIAFSEVNRHVADPANMQVRVSNLLSDDFLSQRAQEISMDRAGYPESRIPADKGTVYLAAADENGMMVSYIQSTFGGFGSGIVVPGTGINLQNRGCGFTLTPGHPNEVGGGKRPYHTIIPGFVTRGLKAVMGFGVMGGQMQPQGHVQMMIRIFDYDQNPQAAADAPRWKVCPDFSICLEPAFDTQVIDELHRRGHRFTEKDYFGGAQLIYCLEDGYCGASDPRKDGQAVGF